MALKLDDFVGKKLAVAWHEEAGPDEEDDFLYLVFDDDSTLILREEPQFAQNGLGVMEKIVAARVNEARAVLALERFVESRKERHGGSVGVSGTIVAGAGEAETIAPVTPGTQG